MDCSDVSIYQLTQKHLSIYVTEVFLLPNLIDQLMNLIFLKKHKLEMGKIYTKDQPTKLRIGTK